MYRCSEQCCHCSARWRRLQRLVVERGWPDRLVTALEQSLEGSVDRGRYAAEADIALVTATADLRRLLDAGLLVVLGGGRATRYAPSDALRAVVAETV